MAIPSVLQHTPGRLDRESGVPVCLARQRAAGQPYALKMSADSPEQRPTVLVVDDIPENIAAMVAMLKDQYRVRVANRGAKRCNWPRPRYRT